MKKDILKIDNILRDSFVGVPFYVNILHFLHFAVVTAKKYCFFGLVLPLFLHF